MKVSVLLLTFNEERNLPRCLDALSWCDDIICVDSNSTDRTLELMRGRGVRILMRPFDNFANQRNFGLSEGAPRHDWVLHLDADEVVTPEFMRKLDALVDVPEIDAYRVPSKTMLHEGWLRYAGMYPTYQVRIGHRQRLRFKQVGHGQREDLAPERVGQFEEPYLHYNFSQGLAAWLRKHLKYAEDEARLLVETRSGSLSAGSSATVGSSTDRRRALKDAAARLPLILRPVARFFYILIWRRGFLDGRQGLLYALMMAVYEGMVAVLATEMLMGKMDAGAAPASRASDKQRSGLGG